MTGFFCFYFGCRRFYICRIIFGPITIIIIIIITLLQLILKYILNIVLFQNGYLQNVATGLCASFYPANTAGNLIAKPCRIRSVHFMEWQWEYSVISGTVNRRHI